MNHIQIDLTENEKANFLKLAKYLLKKYPLNAKYFSFSMFQYQVVHDCGTICCAAGHGPAAGIPFEGDGSDYIDWEIYVRNNFAGYRLGVSSLMVSDWCFCSAWGSTDNTPRGAAKRILYMLKYGVPENASSQMFGYAPLCYTKIKLT